MGMEEKKGGDRGEALKSLYGGQNTKKVDQFLLGVAPLDTMV